MPRRVLGGKGDGNEPSLKGGIQITDMKDAIIGLAIILAGIYLLLTRRQVAHWMYEYYQTRPQRNLPPRWLFHVYRPSERLTLTMVTLFILFMMGAGVYFIISTVY